MTLPDLSRLRHEPLRATPTSGAAGREVLDNDDLMELLMKQMEIPDPDAPVDDANVFHPSVFMMVKYNRNPECNNFCAQLYVQVKPISMELLRSTPFPQEKRAELADTIKENVIDTLHHHVMYMSPERQAQLKNDVIITSLWTDKAFYCAFKIRCDSTSDLLYTPIKLMAQDLKTEWDDGTGTRTALKSIDMHDTDTNTYLYKFANDVLEPMFAHVLPMSSVLLENTTVDLTSRLFAFHASVKAIAEKNMLTKFDGKPPPAVNKRTYDVVKRRLAQQAFERRTLTPDAKDDATLDEDDADLLDSDSDLEEGEIREFD